MANVNGEALSLGRDGLQANLVRDDDRHGARPARDDPGADPHGDRRTSAADPRAATTTAAASATGSRGSTACSGRSQSRGEQGARIEDIARLVGMSKRTVYRDLRALERSSGSPSGARAAAGVSTPSAFLPPLKLTRAEAMAVFLSARLMVRYADEYDADLARGVPEARGAACRRCWRTT